MYVRPEGVDVKWGQRNQTADFARREAIAMAANYNRIAKPGEEWSPTRDPQRTERGWIACIELWVTVDALG